MINLQHKIKLVSRRSKPCNRKPKVRIENAEPTADRRGPTKTAVKSKGDQEDMVGMMIKLLRQQAAPDVDIDFFSSEDVDYYCFITVFEEVVEQKIYDSQGRLARLIRYTEGEPKEMIQRCTQQPVSVVTRMQEHCWKKSMGIRIL